jgi:hypothetical protein
MGWGQVWEKVWLKLFFEPKIFPYKYPTFPTPVTLHTYSPMKMEQTVLQNVGI